MHVHCAADPADAPAFRTRMHRLTTALAAETPVLRARPHLPDTYSNADPHPRP